VGTPEVLAEVVGLEKSCVCVPVTDQNHAAEAEERLAR